MSPAAGPHPSLEPAAPAGLVPGAAAGALGTGALDARATPLVELRDVTKVYGTGQAAMQGKFESSHSRLTNLM